MSKTTSHLNKDSDIDAEVEQFYSQHEKEIDEKFANYCFYEGNFEHQDQKKMFNDDRVFWEFVEAYMHNNPDLAAAMLNTEMAEKLKGAILKHFPSSYVNISTTGPLGSRDVYVHFAYGKTRDDWEFGIINNDPLYTIFAVQGWDDDMGENPIEDAKTVKAKFLTGVRDIKFPSNKMSPETLVKKIDEYFGKLKDYHSSAKSTILSEQDFGDVVCEDCECEVCECEESEVAAEKVDKRNSHNNTGYYDSKNSQYVVLQSSIKSRDRVVTAKLVQKHNKNTDRKEWALVSKSDPSKVLEWYGVQKPSEERVKKSEQRVQYFKHVNASSGFVIQTNNGKYLQSWSGYKIIRIITTDDKEKAMKFPLKQNAEYEMSRINLKGKVVEASVEAVTSPSRFAVVEREHNIKGWEYLVKSAKIFKSLKESKNYILDMFGTDTPSEEYAILGEKTKKVYHWPSGSYASEDFDEAEKKASDSIFGKVKASNMVEPQDFTKVDENTIKYHHPVMHEGKDYGPKLTIKKREDGWWYHAGTDLEGETPEEVVEAYWEMLSENAANASTLSKWSIILTFETDAKDSEIDEVAHAAFVQLESLSDDFGRKVEKSEYESVFGGVKATVAKTKVIAMNDVIKKAEMINSKIGCVSGDWEKELDMKFEEAADVDFESTYSNGNDSISLIDMYIFLKDKSLKVKLGIAGDVECETDEICGKLISAEYSVDGKEYFPFSHFSEEYTNRKLEEGDLLKAGEKALKDQEKLIEKQEKEEAKELEKLKKEYEAK